MCSRTCLTTDAILKSTDCLPSAFDATALTFGSRRSALTHAPGDGSRYMPSEASSTLASSFGGIPRLHVRVAHDAFVVIEIRRHVEDVRPLEPYRRLLRVHRDDEAHRHEQCGQRFSATSSTNRGSVTKGECSRFAFD